MVAPSKPRRIAIACQGGGSRTAFTAGALEGILEQQPKDTEIVALSGSSGGAICVLLTWDGLIRRDTTRAIEQLQRFWRYNTASTLLEVFLNHSIQMAIHMRSLVSFQELYPYAFPSWGQEQLRDMLEKCVDFDSARALARANRSPALFIGAVDVLQGTFAVFEGAEISSDCVLASTAVPNLFPAVGLNGSYYWDGMFSQNPPVRELTGHAPDEIWIIETNKKPSNMLPRTRDDIDHRRNELAGALALEQELRFIEKINTLLDKGTLKNEAYKPIRVHRIGPDEAHDRAAEFDRSESSIQHLIAMGKAKAAQFLESRSP